VTGWLVVNQFVEFSFPDHEKAPLKGHDGGNGNVRKVFHVRQSIILSMFYIASLIRVLETRLQLKPGKRDNLQHSNLDTKL
jgi:hypothetical protein